MGTNSVEAEKTDSTTHGAALSNRSNLPEDSLAKYKGDILKFTADYDPEPYTVTTGLGYLDTVAEACDSFLVDESYLDESQAEVYEHVLSQIHPQWKSEKALQSYLHNQFGLSEAETTTVLKDVQRSFAGVKEITWSGRKHYGIAETNIRKEGYSEESSISAYHGDGAEDMSLLSAMLSNSPSRTRMIVSDNEDITLGNASTKELIDDVFDFLAEGWQSELMVQLFIAEHPEMHKENSQVPTRLRKAYDTWEELKNDCEIETWEKDNRRYYHTEEQEEEDTPEISSKTYDAMFA